MEINPTEQISRKIIVKKIPMEALKPFQRKSSFFLKTKVKGGAKFRNGDTLVTSITPSLENGKTAFVDILNDDEVGFGSTEFIVLRNKKNISDKQFVYYLARSSNFRELAIKSMTGTSGRQRVQIREVINYQFKLPPLPEQGAIVAVLSSFDDKIELLREQNKTLEAIAQLIFKEWFVKFNFPGSTGKMIDSKLGKIPEGWRVGKLGDLCKKMTSGSIPRTNNADYYGGNIDWFSTKEFQDNFIFESDKKITEAGLKNSSAKIFPKGTIVMAIYAAPMVGRLGILAKNATFNQAACGFIPNEEITSSEYIYLLLFSLRGDFNKLARGVAQQNLNVGLVENFAVIIPDTIIMTKFKAITTPIFEKILKGTYQIKTLSILRDTLLPKLMKGVKRA